MAISYSHNDLCMTVWNSSETKYNYDSVFQDQDNVCVWLDCVISKNLDFVFATNMKRTEMTSID